MSHWNQASCDACWEKRNPERQPVRWGGGKTQQCAWCGEETRSGIYVRADPRTVPFPRVEEEDEP